MPEYDNNMTGVLFFEPEKQSEKHPDYTGSVEIDGKKLRLAGWAKRSQSGKDLVSLKVSEFQPRSERGEPDF